MKIVLALIAAFGLATSAIAQNLPEGSNERPLRVMLIPADGSTESGTKAGAVS